jgi:hypothetical protein
MIDLVIKDVTISIHSPFSEKGGPMPMRRVRWFPVLLVVSALSVAPVAAQKAPALPDLLKLAGDYVTQYAHQLGAVCADEEFMQYETTSGRMGTPKRVNSQVVLLGQDDGSIGNFRDLVAIDSVPVRPKDDRLAALFKQPGPQSVGSAEAMTDDAVKAYISPNLHLLDKPTLALDLLRAENQSNYTYKIEGNKTVDGTPVVVLKFNEKGKGHLMTSASAVGRYWIEPATGAVHQTELGFIGQGVPNIHATVKFTKDTQLGVLVPSELSETIEASSANAGMSDMGGGGATTSQHQGLEGRATYAKYRRPGA